MCGFLWDPKEKIDLYILIDFLVRDPRAKIGFSYTVYNLQLGGFNIFAGSTFAFGPYVKIKV